MRTVLKLSAAVVLLVAFNNCGSSAFSSEEGTKVSDEQIAKFTNGKTTRAEVVAALGGPQDTRVESGKQILIYRYRRTCAYCSGDEASTTTFIFNDQGVLQETMKSRDVPQSHH
jgi:outer membrane protein assembly factor BamE (lipoprotein component of BamABCDE complex)